MKKDDLYFDEPLLRRIERAARAENAQVDPSSDREESVIGTGEQDEDETMGGTIKDEAGATSDGTV